jgi:hypothetical protein
VRVEEKTKTTTPLRLYPREGVLGPRWAVLGWCGLGLDLAATGLPSWATVAGKPGKVSFFFFSVFIFYFGILNSVLNSYLNSIMLSDVYIYF